MTQTHKYKYKYTQEPTTLIQKYKELRNTKNTNLQRIVVVFDIQSACCDTSVIMEPGIRL